MQLAGETKGIGAACRGDAPWVVAGRGLHRTGGIKDGTDRAQPVVLVPRAGAARDPCVAIHEVYAAIIEHLLQRCDQVLRVGGTATPYEDAITIVAIAGATLLGQSSQGIVGVTGAAVVE